MTKEGFVQQLALVTRLAEAQSDYQKTLMLLQALKEGTVNLEDVILTERGWNLKMPEQPTVKQEEQPNGQMDLELKIPS